MNHMKKLTALLLALLLCLCASVFAAEEELAGFYAASTVTVGGDEVPAGMLFDEFSLQLEGDGTALLRVEGLATPFTWQFDGTSVLLNEYGGMVFLYEEGRLLFDEEGVLIAFEKSFFARSASEYSTCE